MNKKNRIVLFPFGHVSDPGARELCDGILLRCGADLGRIFDSPMVNVERYVKFIGRIDDVRNGSNPPIIVFTKGTPLPLNVIYTRRKLVQCFPGLQRSLWIIFVDPIADPFFENEARTIGDLDDELDKSPIWKEGIMGERYLVLTPQTSYVELVEQRAQKILSLTLAPRPRGLSSSSNAAVRGPSSTDDPSSSRNKP